VNVQKNYDDSVMRAKRNYVLTLIRKEGCCNLTEIELARIVGRDE